MGICCKQPPKNILNENVLFIYLIDLPYQARTWFSYSSLNTHYFKQQQQQQNAWIHTKDNSFWSHHQKITEDTVCEELFNRVHVQNGNISINTSGRMCVYNVLLNYTHLEWTPYNDGKKIPEWYLHSLVISLGWSPLLSAYVSVVRSR